LSYTQLTREQRYQIYALKKEGHSQTQIARNLGVHKATIGRELSRNLGGRGYRPKQADELAQARQQQRVRPRITVVQWRQVEQLLRQQWSPEQIAGRLELEGHRRISHERIYQHVYADKARGGTLYRHLRCRKQRRKRYGSYSRRGQIPHRVLIDQRPQVVERQARPGDWEADTIVGRGHQAAIVSLVERKSKLTRLARVVRNPAELVTQALSRQLQSLTVKTITSDTGREFAQHQQIGQQLKADFYFAHPDHSWERGVNENTTGLVRQYFPKQSDFSKINDRQISTVVERLTHRPRKTLGYKTPNEVFFKLPLLALTT
jgi:IS30 family transposase